MLQSHTLAQIPVRPRTHVPLLQCFNLNTEPTTQSKAENLPKETDAFTTLIQQYKHVE